MGFGYSYVRSGMFDSFPGDRNPYYSTQIYSAASQTFLEAILGSYDNKDPIFSASPNASALRRARTGG